MKRGRYGAKTRWRWRDDAIAMAQWCNGDDAIEHRAIVIAPSHHRAIAPSRHHAIALSRHRHRAIAQSRHRHRAIASSSSHHRAIVPSTYKSMVRWRDSEVHDPFRIPRTVSRRGLTQVLLCHHPSVLWLLRIQYSVSSDPKTNIYTY